MSGPDPDASAAPLLSVVVPVYNQSTSIVANVGVIVDRLERGLDGSFEVIVVSDGSIDGTEERFLDHSDERVRVVHYDRNLGKGYAIKVGALEARGRWVSYIDADLDLDPASLPLYVETAAREDLHFAIGSKRHPDSHVAYPRWRRVASWFFQQYVRLLLRLDVRDTQVGIKVFQRQVADQVIPLLIVKRYAFDLELLAVAHEFGFDRVEEMPITLDYQFAGSGVNWRAIVNALIDTFAVTYRLRILRYYQRRRKLVGNYGWTRPTRALSDVTVIATRNHVDRLDGPMVQFQRIALDDTASRRLAAEAATTEHIAFVEDGSLPSGNWLTATLPFLARPDVGAVVAPRLSPAIGDVKQRAAAAVSESRIGGGSLHYRFTPGNLRYVSDFPTASLVVRRGDFLELEPSLPAEEVVAALHASGKRVIYSPEAFVTAPIDRLFVPYFRRVWTYGRLRGRAVRSFGRGSLRPSTVGALMFVTFAAFGWLLVPLGHGWLDVWAAVWIAYGAVVLISALVGGVRFGSAAVTMLALVAIPVVHLAYAAGFVGGFVRGRR